MLIHFWHKVLIQRCQSLQMPESLTTIFIFIYLFLFWWNRKKSFGRFWVWQLEATAPTKPDQLPTGLPWMDNNAFRAFLWNISLISTSTPGLLMERSGCGARTKRERDPHIVLGPIKKNKNKTHKDNKLPVMKQRPSLKKSLESDQVLWLMVSV